MIRSRWHKSATISAIVAALVGGLGLLWKASCARTGWGGGVDTYLNLCYSDVAPLYYVRGFADGVFPYLNSFEGRYLEYPVLTGLWMWLVARIVEITIQPFAAFVFITWFMSLAMIVVSVFYLHKLKPNRALWFALSPALFLTLSINWDAAAVLGSVLGIYFWRKGRPVSAGLALGIGAAFKLFPVLLFVAFLVDTIRSGKFRDLIKSAFSGVAIWVGVNLPFFSLNREGWNEFYSFSRERGIDFGSIWLALNKFFDLGLNTAFANKWASVIMFLTVIGLIAFAKRIDMFTAAFVVVAVFALVNKVYSPQFMLWLTPLAVLTAINLRQFVLWQVAQAIYFVGIWRYLLHATDPSVAGGISDFGYALTISIHWLATAAIVTVALRNSIKSRGFSGRLTS